MDITQHQSRPELTVTIGGQQYDFSEIPIERHGDLQVWLNKNIPNPLDELKNGVLEGLPQNVQVALAEAARIEARNWPPKAGTDAAKKAMLGKESGQIFAFHIAIQTHHPGTSAAEAERLYHQIDKDTARLAAVLKRKLEIEEQIATRIFSVAFQYGDIGGAGPKAGSASTTSGTPSTVDANANSA